MLVNVTVLESLDLLNNSKVLVAKSYKYSIKKSIGIPADICWCTLKISDEVLTIGQQFQLDSNDFDLIETISSNGHKIKILKSK